MAIRPPFLSGRCSGLSRWGWHGACGQHRSQGGLIRRSCGPLLLKLSKMCTASWQCLPGQGKCLISLRLLYLQQCNDFGASFSTIRLKAVARHNYLQAAHCFNRQASCYILSAQNEYQTKKAVFFLKPKKCHLSLHPR